MVPKTWVLLLLSFGCGKTPESAKCKLLFKKYLNFNVKLTWRQLAHLHPVF